MTRSFGEQPVDVDVIVDLLDDARRAPSAGFSQGVSFLVLADEAVSTFWDVTQARGWFAERQPGLLNAPLVVVPLADPAVYTERYSQPDKAGHGLEQSGGWPVPYWFADCAMATQNLLLLLESKGLGALYFGIFRNEQALLDRFGVAPGVRALGAVAIGYRAPDDRPSGSAAIRPRRALASVVSVFHREPNRQAMPHGDDSTESG